MRLIDASALKRAINKDKALRQYLDCGHAKSWLMQTIDEQPTIQQEQHWIPCSERLPNKQTEVIVVDFGDIEMAHLNSEGRWVDCYGDKLKDVKAWMPLPKWEGETNA